MYLLNFKILHDRVDIPFLCRYIVCMQLVYKKCGGMTNMHFLKHKIYSIKSIWSSMKNLNFSSWSWKVLKAPHVDTDPPTHCLLHVHRSSPRKFRQFNSHLKESQVNQSPNNNDTTWWYKLEVAPGVLWMPGLFFFHTDVL